MANLDEDPMEKLNEDLIQACSAGDLNAAKKLIDNGADVRHRNKMGISPLSAAAAYGGPEIIEMLLSRGGNTNINDTDYLDRTPLNRASQNVNSKVVELLINNGAFVNHRNKFGDTPLYLCAWWGRLENAKILIEAGAELNEKTKTGITPLEVASRNGNTEMVQLLLSKGAMFDQETIDVAKARNNTDIVNILNSRRQVLRGAMLHKEITGRHIDPSVLTDLHEYMGTQDIDYGGKRRNKRKTRKSRKKNKRRRTNKRRTNKRRTNKRK
jgi:ankyrin repeat protein